MMIKRLIKLPGAIVEVLLDDINYALGKAHK
jgi:hypothetical protein